MTSLIFEYRKSKSQNAYSPFPCLRRQKLSVRFKIYTKFLFGKILNLDFTTLYKINRPIYSPCDCNSATKCDIFQNQ